MLIPAVISPGTTDSRASPIFRSILNTFGHGPDFVKQAYILLVRAGNNQLDRDLVGPDQATSPPRRLAV
jgi:hypothetical protein